MLVFFAISGYLVSASWQADSDPLRFMTKRFLRIWPGLAVAVLMVAFVLGPFVSNLPLKEYLAHPLVRDYLNNLQFTLRDQLPLTFDGNKLQTAVNGSLWTIPIEVKCYCLLGALGVLGLLKQRWALTLLTVLVVFIYGVIEPRGDRIVNILHLRPEQRFMLEFGLFFFAGTMFHQYGLKDNVPRLRKALVLCWVGALIALATNRSFLALWLAVPITILTLGNMRTPYVSETGRFGDMSYGLYLYAFPIQQTLLWLYKDQLSWSAIFVLVLIATFAMAYMSWHFVEKNALKLKPGGQTTLDFSRIASFLALSYIVLR